MRSLFFFSHLFISTQEASHTTKHLDNVASHFIEPPDLIAGVAEQRKRDTGR